MVFLARFNMSTLFPVVIASGFHLFPFRTEKLSPTAPMVLRKRESRSPPSYFQVEALPARLLGGLFVSFYRDNAALFRRGNAALFCRPNAALFRRVCCCKQPKVAASTTPALKASLKSQPESQPESPIKSFGVCACFFLAFSLSL